MKSVKFLLAMLTAVVVMASCATTQSAYDDYENADNVRRVGDRVYVDDPYYGTVILERDPFSGRYYDVTNGYYGSRAYRSPYSTYRGYRGGYYGNRVYRNNGNVGSSIQKPAPSQQETQKLREDARKKILGN